MLMRRMLAFRSLRKDEYVDEFGQADALLFLGLHTPETDLAIIQGNLIWRK